MLCLSPDTWAFPRITRRCPCLSCPPPPRQASRAGTKGCGTYSPTPGMPWRRPRGARAPIACPMGLSLGSPSLWRWRLSYHPVSVKHPQVEPVSQLRSPGGSARVYCPRQHPSAGDHPATLLIRSRTVTPPYIHKYHVAIVGIISGPQLVNKKCFPLVRGKTLVLPWIPPWRLSSRDVPFTEPYFLHQSVPQNTHTI